jgi:predicted 2-oxoglutarate/Fe(II)-dependent dioxygenase YbiX
MADYEWISDEIFTVAGILSSAECDSFVAFSESCGFGDAPIETSFGPIMRKDVRNNARVMVDLPGLAHLLWERAGIYVPNSLAGHQAVGVNERFRFYRYDPGQTFRWHRDGYFERPSGERSRLTLMVYLNEDFDGGETRFVDTVIKPTRGMALFFVHHLLHEGAEVTRGRKYVMRTDVMYGR